ncbi:unnamed protein product [Camellia sinensis]
MALLSLIGLSLSFNPMAIVRSQETSSSNSHCSYDVFLSFRGEDTRKTFTDHLCTALVHAGFRTFRDDDGIERGENIKLELNKAIQESKISIVVFSEDYASSSWCLDELVTILERRRTVGHVVLPVFYHVDPSHVRKQKKSFKEAFMRHEERFRAEASGRKVEWIGKVEEWKAALKDAADLAGMNLQNQTDGFEVLDDVDTVDQLDAILGMRDWLSQGSKIIITTRREQLLKAHEVCQVHKVQKLDHDESLELFSWHAFGENCPIDGFIEESKRVVHYCGGLPLAIKILGSSLSGKCLNVWKSQLEKLKAFPNYEIIGKLKISYDSLQDDHDKNLFLHIACFFVGMDEDWVTTILNGCDFYTTVGIQNLIDRCLLTIDKHKKLVMHNLVQEMGREVVRQESPKEPGERSRLWNCKDSLNVLRESTGTRKIEGLKLDMNLLKEDKYDRTIFGVNRKRHYDEFLNMPFSSNVGNSFKRYYFSFSKNVGTALGNSNQIPLEVDAFARMHKLKLLQLKYIQISGSFENFPKGLQWLCWHGFPFKSIPHDFPLENLTILDMSYSRLQIAWKGAKLLESLKILDLSHSHCLIKTPDFSKAPNLERLILKNCATLVEVHESVGHLQRLVLFNLKDCKSLKKLPRSIGMLKFLETLDISGCSNLEELPTELGTLESLTVFHANKIDISRLFSTSKEVKSWHSLIWPSLLTPRRSMEISWSFLPRSVVHLSLKNCNLSDDDFPRDLSNLSSLQILNLSGTAIRSIPNCIRGHFGLQKLYLSGCKKLWSIEVQNKLKELYFTGCILLEKFEPLGNIDMEIINNLGLSNLGSMGCPNVMLSCFGSEKARKFPLQGCHERHIFYAYCLGSKVPDWFNLKNEVSSISFTVPSHLNFRIRCLSVSHTIISNTTKSLIWSHSPYVLGIPEADEDMMMLSYWKFENQLESGDELNISVVGNEYFQVKEVGVHLVYKEQEEKSSQSTSEEASQQFSLYGNVVPGNASVVRPARKKVYSLGCHWENCRI